METDEIIDMEKKYIMQTYSRPGIVIENGKGCYVNDKDGKKYIDLIGGLATNLIGHGNVEFAETLKKQILKSINPTNLYYTEQQVVLAKKLSILSKLDKCFFSNSGTEAVEAAIKLCRKHTKKTGIISTKHGFHGRTFGSLSATWKEKIKEPFKPLLAEFQHVEYGDVDSIVKTIDDNTGAVLVEPIQGEGGIIVPPDDYLKKLRELCDEQGILMIVDEVQTGCGRTGKFFAYEYSGILPDIVVMAKGLGNGIPIGVTIAKDDVAKSFIRGDHGSTFGGNPVSCAAANFTIDFIESNKLMQNAYELGGYFMGKLKELNLPQIKEIRGKGLMIGVGLKKKNAKKIVENCIEKGLLINSTSDSVLRFLPPLVINKKLIEGSVDIMADVIQNLE